MTITRILVANRGEIARRIMRTARSMGISTVAVFSEPDREAPLLAEADLAVPLGGSTSTESYLDIAKVLRAAGISGADAIHPGYGFLSENPGFARAVVDAGLTWIGPTPESIEAMALKVEAKRLAAQVGVPLVPGAELPAEFGDDDIAKAAASVGYPLLVKASAGGGGKGMRVVDEPSALLDAISAARREAASSFGDPTVFLERYLTRSRHVEVQVFGDRHGQVVHLFERECSIQRRHQKIVEESPSPGITTSMREDMCAAAVSLAREIGYVGAGTVEFIVDGPEFYFLEMNTRLQVEHPVTELVTGLDLVEWQIRVARGEALPLDQAAIPHEGHAIEVRLYAEDPARDYLPNTGVLHEFSIDGARVDSGVESGSVVSSFYDPMLAKVIAHGAERDEARRLLATSLRRAVIHGLVTNRDSLVATLESDAFGAGDTTTAFLDEHREVLHAGPPDAVIDRHLAAIAEGIAGPVVDDSGVPAGWRNVAAVPEWITLQRGDTTVTLTRRWDREGPVLEVIDDGGLPWSSEPRRLSTEVLAPRTVVTAYDGLRCVDDGRWSTAWTVVPRFREAAADAAGRGPSTPVPGTVTLVCVAPGDAVEEGQTLVVLEAMKMEHRIVAETRGVVTEVLVTQGQSVDAHEVVVIVEAAS